jgi:hypothetical protein|tara:strand:+ start:773 stop:1123 length:351 start_codon:yes stop_codon:yes gene_type:complete
MQVAATALKKRMFCHINDDEQISCLARVPSIVALAPEFQLLTRRDSLGDSHIEFLYRLDSSKPCAVMTLLYGDLARTIAVWTLGTEQAAACGLSATVALGTILAASFWIRSISPAA